MRYLLLLAALATAATAAVRHVRVIDRTDVLDGASFGPAGPYERLVMKAEFAVDPKNPANRIITDIDHAPKGEDGRVEFTADAIVVKPRDPAKGNGTILFEVSNRGGMGLLRMFDPGGTDEYGDRHLLEQGYTLVWTGWQFDVPRQQPLKMYPPVARGITGLVRSEFVPSASTMIMPLADRNHVPYPPIDPDSARLTVRDHPDKPARPIANSEWQFTGHGSIHMHAGFEPGKIYELVYRAQDPPIAGLGPAAIRDFISYLKYGGASATSALGDQPWFLKRAIGFGVSQSGRFLRTFLYYGFNADEKNRRVFDGVWAHVAGAGRGSFNIRFAQPSRDGHPLMNLFYPTDIFPFTDLPERDPADGRHLRAAGPDSGHAGSPEDLLHQWELRILGTRRLADSHHRGRQTGRAHRARYAHLLPGGHAAWAERQAGPESHTESRESLRLSLDAPRAAGSDERLDQGRHAAARLAISAHRRGAACAIQAIPFPRMPGIEFPSSIYHAMHLDFGPDFQSKGIVSNEPPKIGDPFPQLVSRVSLERWQRDRRRAVGGTPSARGYLHRLESPLSGHRSSGHASRHDRILHTVRSNQSRARENTRSATFPRRAIRKP